MTTKPKAREFYLGKNPNDEFIILEEAPEAGLSAFVHVIEYSALTEAQAEIERLKKELNAAKTLVAILKDPDEEDVEYYRREWEKCCERCNYRDEEIERLRKALEFIKTKTYSDPLGVEELNVRAARVYEAATKALTATEGNENG